MPAVVRLNDISTGDPCGAPQRPNSQGCAVSMVNSLPIHCATHAWQPHACPLSPPHGATTAAGSPNTFAESLPIARIGDPIDCGSSCQTGSPNTFVN